MASQQPAPQQSAMGAQGNSAAQAGAVPAKRARKAPGERGASPKVKALSEARTFLIQSRARIASQPDSVEKEIEIERFDRMIDSVETFFPKGHKFSIKRPVAPVSPTEG